MPSDSNFRETGKEDINVPCKAVIVRVKERRDDRRLSVSVLSQLAVLLVGKGENW